MGGVDIETGMIIAAAILLLAGAGLYLARRDDVTRWNTDRRTGDRRDEARRTSQDRRGELRLEHDAKVNNTNRRRSDRREGERREPGDWEIELEQVRSRVEEIQHNDRNG